MKNIFLTALVMMSSVAVYAQCEVGTITLQPKVGLNVAYFTGDEGVDTKPRLGVAAGVEIEYQLRKAFSLSAGIIYSQQGEKATIKRFLDERTITAKTDYVNFPILANIYVLKGLALKFGIQPAVNVKAGYTYDLWEGDLSYYGIYVKTFDFAVPVGLSYEYKNLVIDARYNIGLTRMVEDDESRNRTFQFTIGYKKSF